MLATMEIAIRLFFSTFVSVECAGRHIYLFYFLSHLADMLLPSIILLIFKTINEMFILIIFGCSRLHSQSSIYHILWRVRR